ncbi:Membrane-bound lytic murein transglycosylase B, partial [hydrothermal vent metagenome]
MRTSFFYRLSRLAPGPAVFLLPLFLCLLLVMKPAVLSAAPRAADLVRNGQPIDLGQAKYKKLFHELEAKHNFSPASLQTIFRGQTINKRVLELMDRQWEAKPYYQYAPLFLTKRNIETGRKKLRQYRKLLDRIEKKIGVDREIVIAIWGIETHYGANQGSFSVLRTLNTLFDAYPRRSQFFRKQLVYFLLLCRQEGIDPKTIRGSYAGAFGQTQFIPSSFSAYALSFDGDRKRDVWNSVPDILASIANYLKHFKWKLHAPIYAELGHELKDHRLVAASLKGRQGSVSWQLLRQVQRSDLPRPRDHAKLFIVGLELPPGSGARMR